MPRNMRERAGRNGARSQEQSRKDRKEHRFNVYNESQVKGESRGGLYRIDEEQNALTMTPAPNIYTMLRTDLVPKLNNAPICK